MRLWWRRELSLPRSESRHRRVLGTKCNKVVSLNRGKYLCGTNGWNRSETRPQPLMPKLLPPCALHCLWCKKNQKRNHWRRSWKNLYNCKTRILHCHESSHQIRYWLQTAMAGIMKSQSVAYVRYAADSTVTCSVSHARASLPKLTEKQCLPGIDLSLSCRTAFPINKLNRGNRTDAYCTQCVLEQLICRPQIFDFQCHSA